MTLMTALLLLAPAADAQDAPEPDPRRLVDVTAFTVPHKTWRVGLSRIDYGLTDNVSVGTRPLFLALGGNINAKITAIDTERLGLSVSASTLSVYSTWIGAITGSEGSSASLSVSPISVRGTWIATPKWSAHLGSTWNTGALSGQLNGDQLESLIGAVIGSSVDFSEAFGDENTLYADASGRFVLRQANFALEWRRTPKATWIFESNSYVNASILVVGTVGTSSEEGEVGAGAAASFESSLEGFPTASSIAWQRHWDRFNLRLGIPLTFNNPFSYTQAFTLYWMI